jgi:hypothetical protein
MTDNRRNFYRVLHVQPDAPMEVIRSSYRTLLSSLRMHPDLGGTHAQAVLVNQAWEVLGDPDRRAAYDQGLHEEGRDGPAQRDSPPPAEGRPAGLSLVARALHDDETCPLCDQPVRAPVRQDSRCSHCHSPLALLPEPSHEGQELFGRRGAVRRHQDHVAQVHLGWPSPALPVRWRDLSLTGLSFYAARAVPIGQRLRLVDVALEGVVEVVNCRAQGRVHTVHARWLTGLLLQTTGVFVSARA